MFGDQTFSCCALGNSYRARLGIGKLVLMPSKPFVPDPKYTFLIEDSEASMEGTLHFSALKRLKVCVGEAGVKVVLRATGVFFPERSYCVWDLSSVRA